MRVATINTPFRNELEEKWGKLLFINEEIELKIVSPEIIEYLQKESKLKNEYSKLTASDKIEFDGKVLNISKIGAYLENLDPLTGEFFNMILDNELIDVTTRHGKRIGRYCDTLPKYKLSFIFANFNGTSHD